MANARLLIIFLLGFSSGLPLALTASTLAAWLSESHVDKSTIGLFAAVALPYTLKFLWAPVIDSLNVPLISKLLGRRRGWLFTTQCALILTLVGMAMIDPALHPYAIALAALLVAFCSASQDIVIDAFRVELLPAHNQGKGAAMIQLGYRLGMLASGAGALYLASTLSWHMTYLCMAALVGVGIATTLCSREPHGEIIPPRTHSFTEWFTLSVIAPLQDFTTRKHWLLILAFIVFYRLADAFIGLMTNPFFLELGFSKTDIASIVKIYGTAATLIGTLLGGWMTARFGALRVILLSGVLHALTNLCYVWQDYAGVNTSVLAISIAVENFTGGISSAAFVAYLSGLCNLHYTATQYALLSSLAAVTRTVLATPAGYAVNYLGWRLFFTYSAALALPGLLLAWHLKKLEVVSK